jgi:peptide/nickel transport system permease protein
LVRYLIRRLLLMVVLLLGVSVMVFLISHMVPSNPSCCKPQPDRLE